MKNDESNLDQKNSKMILTGKKNQIFKNFKQILNHREI